MSEVTQAGMGEIAERLAELERLGLNRRLRLVSGPQGPTVLLDGKPVLLLCSNNYLGLADHPRVREAAAEAAMRWGIGAGASRLVSGTMTIHRRLEERLATFERSQACLLFGSGYLANIGVISALAGSGDTVFSDELNHASIVDGCRLSRAEVVVYRHLDVEHLHWSLRRHGGRRDGRGNKLIVTDSVFSMDGDVAPLAEIVELAQACRARVAVDEAHATGTFGPDGRGAIAQAIRPPTVPPGTSRLRLAAMASHTASDMRLAASVLGSAARKLGLDPAEIGPPQGDPEPVEAMDAEYEYSYETQEAGLAAMDAGSPSGSPSGVPFDIDAPEQPRPRRPPAPAPAHGETSNAPFDVERETSIAHAA